MRKLVSIALSVALAASLVQAGGPPRGEGGERGGRRGGPGGDRRARMFERMRGMMAGRMGGPGRGMFGAAGQRTDVFEVVRRGFELSQDNQVALQTLGTEYAVEEDDAIAELRKRLIKEYLVKIVKLLPDEDKAKYEKVIAAMTERDEAIAAAQKELREVLDKVKASQGADKVVAEEQPGRRFFRPRPGTLPTSKLDMVRTCFVLTQDQRNDIDQLQRGGFEGMRDQIRERMRAQQQAGGARGRGFREVITQIREEVDEKNAKAVADMLTDAQKKDYETASAAMDTAKKKTTEAEEACKKKVIEILGEEKGNVVLGLARPAPAAPQRRTEF